MFSSLIVSLCDITDRKCVLMTLTWPRSSPPVPRPPMMSGARCPSCPSCPSCPRPPRTQWSCSRPTGQCSWCKRCSFLTFFEILMRLVFLVQKLWWKGTELQEISNKFEGCCFLLLAPGFWILNVYSTRQLFMKAICLTSITTSWSLTWIDLASTKVKLV